MYTKAMFDDCLIMAGGSGTRLWPASNSKLPKQFLPAEKNKSFFSLAVERALSVADRVIIITGKSHIPHVIAAASKLSAAEKKKLAVIGEPEAKNTAPAIACAVVYSKKQNMLVLTSDHIIKPIKVFKANAALAQAGTNEGNLVVFGIPPARPETGYGYIETAEETKPGIYRVCAFHEKPDIDTAEKYTASGNFFWNSGMFAFNVNFMTEQFKAHAPEVFGCFEKLKTPKHGDFSTSGGVKVLKKWQGLEAAYRKTKSISFDYAIAEKCEKKTMIKAEFDWIDIGNWDEYIKISGKNGSQTFYSGGGETCYVDSDIPVAIAGAEDLIVVIRNNRALITKKGQTGKVKDIVEQIKKARKTELL
jgi:mannose-1-phosphate guanylyltransferase/mannose-1-phosphate guanylyltransferase/mannose-6-phosphate isomerase